MITATEKNHAIVNGEMNIIHEEIDKFNSLNQTNILDIYNFLHCVKLPLSSINNKIGINSIEYITATTKITDVVSNRLLAITSFPSCNIEKLSPSDIVNYYANKREYLYEALNICRNIEGMNMDYAYRSRSFNKTKEEIENRCREINLDLKTSPQKIIYNLKIIGNFPKIIAKGAAGCAIRLIVLIAEIVYILLIFFILMAAVRAISRAI